MRGSSWRHQRSRAFPLSNAHPTKLACPAPPRRARSALTAASPSRVTGPNRLAGRRHAAAAFTSPHSTLHALRIFAVKHSVFPFPPSSRIARPHASSFARRLFPASLRIAQERVLDDFIRQKARGPAQLRQSFPQREQATTGGDSEQPDGSHRRHTAARRATPGLLVVHQENGRIEVQGQRDRLLIRGGNIRFLDAVGRRANLHPARRCRRLRAHSLRCSRMAKLRRH